MIQDMDSCRPLSVSIPTDVITLNAKRHRQTDGRSDDLLWHNLALRSIARCAVKSKLCNTQIKSTFV